MQKPALPNCSNAPITFQTYEWVIACCILASKMQNVKIPLPSILLNECSHLVNCGTRSPHKCHCPQKFCPPKSFSDHVRQTHQRSGFRKHTQFRRNWMRTFFIAHCSCSSVCFVLFLLRFRFSRWEFFFTCRSSSLFVLLTHVYRPLTFSKPFLIFLLMTFFSLFCELKEIRKRRLVTNDDGWNRDIYFGATQWQHCTATLTKNEFVQQI